MTELIYTAQLTGRDKTKVGAFANALSKLQGAITQEVTGIPLRIEPLAVQIEEAQEVVTTEKFLFLFLPKEVRYFTLKLQVRAKLILVDIDQHPFETVQR